MSVDSKDVVSNTTQSECSLKNSVESQQNGRQQNASLVDKIHRYFYNWEKQARLDLEIQRIIRRQEKIKKIGKIKYE